MSLSPDVGLVFGVHVSTSLTWQILRFGDDGVQTPAALEGYTPLDALPLGDGRALLLLLEGGDYPTDDVGPWTLHVGLTWDGTDYSDLLVQEVDEMPWSVAFWQRRLFLGMEDGAVWMAAGSR